MALKAVFLNCTLKKSPERSNTRALMDKVAGLMGEMNVESEFIRVVDYNIPFGISSYMGEGDEWPIIYDKIKQCNIIVVGMPIWFGVRSSVAQLVIERLDGSYEDGDAQTGQFPLYNKVAGVVVTGNEDGAHDCSATTLFNLSHLGCIIPPNVDCYWVGDAGPGPNYLDGDADKHLYTNKTARYMANNLVAMAKIIEKHPITTNMKQCIADATAYSQS